jgi:hypothetical protein
MIALKPNDEVLWMGRVFVTQGILEILRPSEISAALDRHGLLNWGDVPDEDKRANDEAMKTGLRVLSAWTSEAGAKFWIITEADRSMTTVLLPSEY